ncbi:MAG: hypothetical protein Q4P72_02015, partial [Eubacteriales bacterium]|nr:hypothetical protein [Eubacteriales bacterium]
MKPFKLYTATILASVMFYAGTEIQALEAQPKTDPGKVPGNKAVNPTKQNEEDPTLAEAKAELQRREDAKQLAEVSQSGDEVLAENGQLESSSSEVRETELAPQTDKTELSTDEQALAKSNKQAALGTDAETVVETDAQALAEPVAESEAALNTSSESLKDVELPEHTQYYPDRMAKPGEILDETGVDAASSDADSQESNETLIPLESTDLTTSSTAQDDNALTEINPVVDEVEVGDEAVETPDAGRAAEAISSQSDVVETQAAATPPVTSESDAV